MRITAFLAALCIATPCAAQQWIAKGETGPTATADLLFDGEPLTLPMDGVITYEWLFGERENDILVAFSEDPANPDAVLQFGTGPVELLRGEDTLRLGLSFSEELLEPAVEFRGLSQIEIVKNPSPVNPDEGEERWRGRLLDITVSQPPMILDSEFLGHAMHDGLPVLLYNVTVQGPTFTAENPDFEIGPELGMELPPDVQLVEFRVPTQQLAFFAQTIPEPRAWVLALVMAAAAVVWKYGRRADRLAPAR